jgi:hypothetical protein
MTVTKLLDEGIKMMKNIVNNSWQATNHDALAGILPLKNSQTNLSFEIDYPRNRNW